MKFKGEGKKLEKEDIRNSREKMEYRNSRKERRNSRKRIEKAT